MEVVGISKKEDYYILATSSGIYNSTKENIYNLLSKPDTIYVGICIDLFLDMKRCSIFNLEMNSILKKDMIAICICMGINNKDDPIVKAVSARNYYIKYGNRILHNERREKYLIDISNVNMSVAENRPLNRFPALHPDSLTMMYKFGILDDDTNLIQ